MSNFSTALTKLMDRKGAVNNEVIRYTGINRSTFFKLKTGSRGPSGLEMVDNIARALRLSADDRQSLFKAYEIDRIGAYRYYGIEKIRQFFLSDVRTSSAPAVEISLPEFGENEHVRIYRDRPEVLAAIMGVLSGKSSTVRIMENRMSSIYKTAIPQAAKANPETSFVHIFKLKDTETVELEHQLYNVNCFQNVMDITIRTEKYHPRYMYSQVTEDHGGQQVNFILSDRYLLSYSDSLDSAILYNTADLLDLYKDIFEEGVRLSTCFVETTDLASIMERGVFFEVFEDGEDDIYNFTPGICTAVTARLTAGLIRSYIRDDYEGKENLMRSYPSYSERLRKQTASLGKSAHLMSACSSLEYFARTGYISEFPRKAAVPLNQEGRKRALKVWKEAVRLYNYQGIQDRCIPEDSSLSMVISKRIAVIMLVLEQEMKTLIIRVSEPGVVALLYGYMEKLERESLMDKEDYLAFIDSLIERVDMSTE